MRGQMWYAKLFHTALLKLDINWALISLGKACGGLKVGGVVPYHRAYFTSSNYANDNTLHLSNTHQVACSIL